MKKTSKQGTYLDCQIGAVLEENASKVTQGTGGWLFEGWQKPIKAKLVS